MGKYKYGDKEPGDIPELDKRLARHSGASKAGRAADALANVVEDEYPDGVNYKQGVAGGPNPKPRSISRNPDCAQ